MTSSAALHAQEAAPLMKEAEALLKKRQKKKALSLLERAFDISKDPEEIRQIGNLILDAAPYDYPKRENFLRYLVKFVPEHPDASTWMQELGKRAMAKSEWDEAEDWLLRAQILTPNDPRIEEALLDVYMSKEQNYRALDLAVKLVDRVEPNKREHYFRKISKIWWGMGALPPEYFSRLTQASYGEQLLRLHLKKIPESEKSAAGIRQIYESANTRSLLPPKLLNDIEKPPAPVMTPDVAVAPEVAAPPASTEEPEPAPQPSVEAKPEPSSPPVVVSEAPRYHYVEGQESKAELIHKAVSLAQLPEPPLRQINEIVIQIYNQHPLDPTEAAVKENMILLESRKKQDLPDEFNEEFLGELKSWEEDLDRAIKVIGGASEEWKIITRPFLRSLIDNNRNRMIDQIQKASLSAEQKKSKTLVNSQKAELIRNLEKKYPD